VLYLTKISSKYSEENLPEEVLSKIEEMIKKIKIEKNKREQPVESNIFSPEILCKSEG
jgi:hypothetical protein